MQGFRRHIDKMSSVLQRRWRVAAALVLACGLSALPVSVQAKPGTKKTAPAAEAVSEEDRNDPRPALLVGFAGPLSGTAAGVGKSMQNAVQLAIIEANQRGVRVGTTTYRLKLVAQDDRADPGTAEFVARYLANQKVVGVIGHWNSGASLAAAPVYHGAGIVQISPATFSRQFTALGYPGVFRTIPNNEGVGRHSAAYVVKKLGVKTVATIDDRTPFGHGLAEEFARSARELGVEVVGSYSVSDKTSDFNGPLLQLRKHQPELIFFGGLDWQAALVARAIKRLKISARLMGAAGTVGLPFLMSSGADGNGTLVLEPGLPTEKMPGWKSFRLRYGNQFDNNVDFYATFAYDAANALIQAIRQADSTDMAAIVQALRKLRFNGVSGPIAFNEEGDLLNPSFTMYEVQDRRWIPVQQINGNSSGR